MLRFKVDGDSATRYVCHPLHREPDFGAASVICDLKGLLATRTLLSRGRPCLTRLQAYSVLHTRPACFERSTTIQAMKPFVQIRHRWI